MSTPQPRRLAPDRRRAVATLVVALLVLAVFRAGSVRWRDAWSGDPCVFPTIRAVAGQETLGTPGDDVIVGTEGFDEIHAWGGDDVVCGRGGDDRIDLAGSGRMQLFSDPPAGGDDRGFGEDGNDVISSDAGVLDGGPGDDRLSGGKGPHRLLGGDGDDVLLGGLGSDVLEGGPGDDELEGGPPLDPGTDRCDGGPGFDREVTENYSAGACDEMVSLEVPYPRTEPGAGTPAAAALVRERQSDRRAAQRAGGQVRADPWSWLFGGEGGGADVRASA